LASEEAAQKKLADDELRVARLEREVKLEEMNYQKHVESLEQASIDRELAEEGKSNISIVQPATYDLKPVKPKIVINMGLGIAIGLMGAVALAMAANSLDDKIRTSHDVESELDLPVLANLPRFKSAQLTPQGGGK
jgi:capsular polysaccharide biosynthesis protein